jgi:hypothetical protein
MFAIAGSAGIVACNGAERRKTANENQVKFQPRVFERWRVHAGNDACAPSQNTSFMKYFLNFDETNMRLVTCQIIQ